MKKILVVFFHGNLFQPRAGSDVRVHNLVKALAREYRVITLESVEYRSIPRTVQVERRYFFNDLKVGGMGFGRTFANFNIYYLKEVLKIVNKEKPDIIQIEYPYGLIPSKIISNLLNTNIIVVYDAHDVELERLRNILQQSNLDNVDYLKHKVSCLYNRAVEKLSCMFADHIISVSEVDKKLFCKLYSINPQKITVIPSGANVPKPLNKLSCREKLNLPENKILVVFHGSYQYPPNKEAINLIKGYVAPKLKSYRDVFFVIAGKDLPKYEKNNIKLLGFVDNIYELLYACDIAICPILSGGGTRIKIMDYMSVGLPVVSTKKGIEGIDAENYRHAIITNCVDKNFIDSMIYFIENKNERKKFGKNTRRLIEKKYNWKKIGEKLNILYNKLLEV